MFRGMRYDKADLSSPMNGIANPAADITPCNEHLDDVPDDVPNDGGMPIEFGKITISDPVQIEYGANKSVAGDLAADAGSAGAAAAGGRVAAPPGRLRRRER